MALINSVLSWLMKKRFHQIELFMKYPYEVQSECFKKLIYSAKDTEWGKKYDYKTITNLEKFKERVPLNDYDSLKPYIDRLRKGEQNILWNTDIKWFAKSSGTTSNKSKFIPVSTESLEECHFKAGRDLLSIYCNNNPNTFLFDGRGLIMGGSHNISEINNKEYYVGDLSAIIIQNLPLWVEFIRVPKRKLALLDEWESKIEQMAHATISRNVTNISGVPSWMLLLLKRILEITGKSNLMEVWPNLEVFFHGGVNFGPYREQFHNLIPSDKMNYMENYNASEGFFGIQDKSDSDELLLMLDYGVFYEFLPLDQLNKENPDTLALDEVELNTNYAIIISTNAGLWRYLIGDTIIFTSLDPFRIKITGRTKNFINSVGEELIIDNAEKALAIACEKCKAVINEYTAAPVYFKDNENAAHEWLIEFEKLPENLDFFTETLDNALKSLNSDYEAKRYHSMVLREPIVKAVPRDTFYNWLKKKGKLGGQNKVPRLSNDRKHIDEILKINEKKSNIIFN
ncbi:MAG: GH3 auxin-responsive promoter family protein [Bacteroidetes bacterium]|nr:GH3 auxin-responsive promoter family protein [Bacteroidota bacterium]